jgi:hypothetical protein
LAPIVVLLFSLCAAGTFASDDGREIVEAAADLAAYAPYAEEIFISPFSTPTARPLVQFFSVDRRVAFDRIMFGRSLSLDREGRLFIDFNTSLSVGVKPEMGSLAQWAESFDASDLLRSLSVYVHVRY